MTETASPLVGKTNREVVLGTRGAIHIAHPMSERTLCDVAIGSRPGVDAFGRTSVDGFDHNWPAMNPRPIDGYHACHQCRALTFAPGNEHRQ